MTPETVLESLAHGGWRQARDLGVSEDDLDVPLTALADVGVAVERSADHGFRIPGGVDLLDRSEILAAVDPELLPLIARLDVMRIIDSTNAECLRRPRAAGGQAQVCLADCQTAGRGRRGRSWVSPLGCNLYLSLDWLSPDDIDRLQGLPLAVGVIVAETAADLGAPGISLKWPNDVLHDGAKIAGILVESVALPDGGCRTVVGIGINVRMPQSAAAAVDQRWTDLSAIATTEPPSRSLLAGSLLQQLLPLLRDFSSTGFAEWRDRWMERDAFADKPVELSSGERRIRGIARGVDVHGALRLETDAGLQTVHGGELSLRAAG